MIVRTAAFLKATDVKQGEILTINDEGREEVSKKFTNTDGTPKNQYLFGVTLSTGEERTLAMNGMSMKNLAKEYGADTVGWIGKKAMVNIMLLPIGKNAIVLTPIK